MYSRLKKRKAIKKKRPSTGAIVVGAAAGLYLGKKVTNALDRKVMNFVSAGSHSAKADYINFMKNERLSRTDKLIAKGFDKVLPGSGSGYKEFARSENVKHLTSKSKPLLKTVGRRALAALPIVGVGVLAYDVATSGAHTAKKVNKDLANNQKADKARLKRVKAGKGGIFQRALDFDIGEYLSGDYSNKPKKIQAKVRSVQGELASSSKGSKPKAKSTTRKKASTTKAKRAGAKIKVVRGGKTFYRKNPHYGK